ncbi:MAG: hypothetical protein PHI38_03635 [Sulfurimonas sp.]|uniref:hypothetical protein n=1 Tax=Sulfurimonas sp. TaxID=2022749 RepID=UPI002613D295|nr:hypothetical protein [Sulfurimonas sp.]MDD3475938.1 hypothetical protein [Sulfurimonas sp.]
MIVQASGDMMKQYFIALILYLSLSINLIAENNTTQHTFNKYVDESHKEFSNYVVDFFSGVDNSISYWVKDTDNNETIENQTLSSVDEFFKDKKFIEDLESSFIRLRLGTTLQSKESIDFNYKIRAQIPLSRTKKSFQLFISDIEDNHIDTDVLALKKNTSTQVGVNYFAPIYKDIKSKYSIGISSLTPYAKARYSKDFKANKWLIQPTQQFKYSFKSDWSEETNIYFDRALDERSLFRTTLHRSTQAHVDGFDYALSFSYYLTPSHKKGFAVSQLFWGNSKYSCEIHPEQYSGISNYATQFSWRQNIFRKWITYEIQPIVSFHREYNYEPNYILQFNLDFYFGNIN